MTHEEARAIAHLPVRPGEHWYLHLDGQYWTYKGLSPTGQLRLYRRARRPYRQQVHHLDPATGTWSVRRAAPGLHPWVLGWLVAATAVCLLAAALLRGQDPIIFKTVLLVAGGGGLLAALVVQFAPPGAPSDEWDTPVPDHPYIPGPDGHAARLEAWARASYGQQLGVNDTLNPGKDSWGAYGQYPPL
ncbi:hypothetical protein [Kitasatospora viridis]|nr:hypothetical protein [Kitasatospora viridis]